MLSRLLKKLKNKRVAKSYLKNTKLGNSDDGTEEEPVLIILALLRFMIAVLIIAINLLFVAVYYTVSSWSKLNGARKSIAVLGILLTIFGMLDLFFGLTTLPLLYPYATLGMVFSSIITIINVYLVVR